MSKISSRRQLLGITLLSASILSSTAFTTFHQRNTAVALVGSSILGNARSHSTNSDDSRLCSVADNTQESNIMSKQQGGGQPVWFQHEMSITAPSRGCHLITRDIEKKIGSDLKQIKVGLANIFIQHTSASLTINENADPSVRTDMETALNRLVPASWNRDGTFTHTMEGDDDMPGHVKSSLMGPSVNIPIRNGRLALGTWQGIYLNEHRDQGGWGGGHTRNLVVTLQGQT